MGLPSIRNAKRGHLDFLEKMKLYGDSSEPLPQEIFTGMPQGNLLTFKKSNELPKHPFRERFFNDLVNVISPEFSRRIFWQSSFS
jgi:hypothetical protein